jgi:hypothetical protein
MCGVIEQVMQQQQHKQRGEYQLVSIPTYYRYPLERDSLNGVTDMEKLEFRRESSFEPSQRRQVPSVLLTVAGHNVDWYLFDSSFATTKQYLYELSDISLDCELDLSVPSFNIPTHMKVLPIGALWENTEYETQPESLVNYTLLRDILYPSPTLCRKLFGTLLPDTHKYFRMTGQPAPSPSSESDFHVFNAVPDWVISPLDYEAFAPNYNADEYAWDGRALSKTAAEDYATFLKTTEPTSFYRNPLTMYASSRCSIQILA